MFDNPSLDTTNFELVKIGEDENQNALQYGDVIFTLSSETPNECGMSSVVTKELNDTVYLNSFCFFFRMDNPNIMIPSFAKHLFRSYDLRKQITKTAQGGYSL